jgi:hypothetical protein
MAASSIASHRVLGIDHILRFGLRRGAPGRPRPKRPAAEYTRVGGEWDEALVAPPIPDSPMTPPAAIGSGWHEPGGMT